VGAAERCITCSGIADVAINRSAEIAKSEGTRKL
jgi:hypothetical protein